MCAAARVGVGAHRHVVGDHRDLGLEIDAPGFVAERRVVARASRSSEPPW